MAPSRAAANLPQLHDVYREREAVFTAVMADREDWDLATRAQRHLALAADTELRRPPSQSAFPPAAFGRTPASHPTQRAELTPTTGELPGEMGQLITDLAAAHCAFTERLANRHSLTVPSLDPGYGDLGQAFPLWLRPGTDAILQPPMLEIRPSLHVLERAADRDADWEAAE